MFFLAVCLKLCSFLVRNQFSSKRDQFVKTFICNKTEFGWLKCGAELTEGQSLLTWGHPQGWAGFWPLQNHLLALEELTQPGKAPGSFGSDCWSLTEITHHQKRLPWEYLISFAIVLSKSVPVEVLKSW